MRISEWPRFSRRLENWYGPTVSNKRNLCRFRKENPLRRAAENKVFHPPISHYTTPLPRWLRACKSSTRSMSTRPSHLPPLHNPNPRHPSPLLILHQRRRTYLVL